MRRMDRICSSRSPQLDTLTVAVNVSSYRLNRPSLTRVEAVDGPGGTDMTRRLIAVAMLAVAVCGCATSPMKVIPGVHRIGDMNVEAGPGWTVAPRTATRISSSSRSWTQGGVALDRLIFVPRAKSIDEITNSRGTGEALPTLTPDTPPDELEALAQFVILTLYAATASVHAENPRAQAFDGRPGIVFDFRACKTSEVGHGIA